MADVAVGSEREPSGWSTELEAKSGARDLGSQGARSGHVWRSRSEQAAYDQQRNSQFATCTGGRTRRLCMSHEPSESVDERPRRVSYVASPALIAAADLLPSNRGRTRRVHALIEALPACSSVRCVASQRATEADLLGFHSEELVGMSAALARTAETIRSASG